MTSRATALLSPRAMEKAADYYAAQPALYLYGLTYCRRLAERRQDAAAQDVTQTAAALLPSFIHPERQDDPAAVRSAARRAVQRAAAAVAQDEKAAPLPYDISTDETRTILATYAPDPAAAWQVSTRDRIAAAVRSIDNDAARLALGLAVCRALRSADDDRRATLTTRTDSGARQRRISAATDEAKRQEARTLADPAAWTDADRIEPHQNDWTAGTRTRRPTTELDAAARPSRATLAALRAAAQDAAEVRDRLRVQVALAQMEGAQDADLWRTVGAWQRACQEANRRTAGLAHAETHAARAARRTDVEPRGIDYDPAALSPYPRNLGPKRPDAMPKDERPAQVPQWATPGGTARPLIGAVVEARWMDTGVPGTEVARVTIWHPDALTDDGTRDPDAQPWRRFTISADAWTDEDTRTLSRALATPGEPGALDHAERIVSRPRHGTPKKPSPTARGSRVGSTGPTVPAWGMTR